MDRILIKIKDKEHWEQIREECVKKLLVVDVHKEWSGHSRVMEPTYKRIYGRIDNAEMRLQFSTVCSNLEIEELPELKSCKPLFLLFLGKERVGEIVGANAPELELLVQRYVPNYVPDEDAA